MFGCVNIWQSDVAMTVDVYRTVASCSTLRRLYIVSHSLSRDSMLRLVALPLFYREWTAATPHSQDCLPLRSTGYSQSSMPALVWSVVRISGSADERDTLASCPRTHRIQTMCFCVSLCLNGRGPECITRDLHLAADVTTRARLRSASSMDLMSRQQDDRPSVIVLPSGSCLGMELAAFQHQNRLLCFSFPTDTFLFSPPFQV